MNDTTMTFTPFRHLEISEKLSKHDKPEQITRFIESNPSYRAAIESVYDLADLAVLIFMGIYPKESVSFYWGEGVPLPWYSNSSGPTDDRVWPNIKKVAGVLGLSSSEPCNMRMGPSTYLSRELCVDSASVARSLSVEVLLCADEFLELLLLKRFDAALPWLSAAYSAYLEAIANARDSLTSTYTIASAV
jgi:hypothetical protein